MRLLRHGRDWPLKWGAQRSENARGAEGSARRVVGEALAADARRGRCSVGLTTRQTVWRFGDRGPRTRLYRARHLRRAEMCPARRGRSSLARFSLSLSLSPPCLPTMSANIFHTKGIFSCKMLFSVESTNTSWITFHRNCIIQSSHVILKKNFPFVRSGQLPAPA